MILGGPRPTAPAPTRTAAAERRWAAVDLLTLYTLADSRQEMLAAFEQLEEARRRAGGRAV